MRGGRAVRLAAATAAAAMTMLAAACDSGPDGGPVAGPGYETVLPDGWEEAGDLEQAAIATQIDVELESTWVRDEPVEGFRANANVVGGSVAPGTSVLEFAREQRDQLLDRGYIESRDLEDVIEATALGGVRPTTLAGEPAATFEVRNLSSAGKLRQRVVVAIRDRQAHLITMTAHSSAFEEVEPEFDEILGSWSWTGGGPLAQ